MGATYVNETWVIPPFENMHTRRVCIFSKDGKCLSMIVFIATNAWEYLTRILYQHTYYVSLFESLSSSLPPLKLHNHKS